MSHDEAEAALVWHWAYAAALEKTWLVLMPWETLKAEYASGQIALDEFERLVGLKLEAEDVSRNAPEGDLP